jgi:hypothetical protein
MTCPDCPHDTAAHYTDGCMLCTCKRTEDELRRTAGRAEGERLKDEGTARVLDASDEWREAVYSWVGALPQGYRLTSTDVIEAVGMAPRSNAVGAVMTAMRKTGLLIPTDIYVKSPRPKSHAAIVAVWVRA